MEILRDGIQARRARSNMRFRSANISTLALSIVALLGACGKSDEGSAKPIPVSDVPFQTPTNVPLDTVAVATTACTNGYEHPSICCSTDGPGYVPLCETYPTPFYPCDIGFATYPNAASCCSLENPNDCSAGTSAADAESDVATCAGRCPPGTTDDGTSDHACCKVDSAGNEIDCHLQPVTSPSCTYVCPVGWDASSPYGDIALCCRDDLSECFAAVLSDGSNISPK
jgi:hypothetical protein